MERFLNAADFSARIRLYVDLKTHDEKPLSKKDHEKLHVLLSSAVSYHVG